MKNTTKKQSSKKFKKSPTLQKEKSPSISRSFTDKHERGSHFQAARSITEKSRKETAQSFDNKIPKNKYLALVLNKYFIVSFLTTFLGVALTLQGISVQKSLQSLENIKNERTQIEKEVIYWEDVVKDHKGYRDAYFKLALLEFQLGNKDKAKTYTEKTLEIDPNYAPAREFRKEVGIPYSL